MKKTRTLGGVALVSALALAACSTDETDPDTPESPPEEQEAEFTELSVGEPFGEASWGMDDVDNIVTVTADRVVAEQGGELVAWDSEGEEVWSESLPGESSTSEDDEDVDDGLADAAENEEDAPDGGAGDAPDDGQAEVDDGLGDGVEVRQIGPETVAVIMTGEVEGEDLDLDSYGAEVTLHDITDGSVISEHEIEGDENSYPDLSNDGLAFVLPSGEGLAITADGEERTVEGFATQGGPPDNVPVDNPVGTVGNTVFWTTDDGAEESTGSATDTWQTDQFGLLDYALSAGITSVDQAQGTVVVTAQGEEAAHAWVDAESGEVLTELEEPFEEALVYSPNSEYAVSGSSVISGTDVESVGGSAEGQEAVVFTAITDDGTAYGSTMDGDDFVVVPEGGEPEVSDLPEGSESPVAVLEGDLAVHYDSDEGVVNANPIE